MVGCSVCGYVYLLLLVGCRLGVLIVLLVGCGRCWLC